MYEHHVLIRYIKSWWILDATIQIKQDSIARNFISCATIIFRCGNQDNIEAPICLSGFLSKVLYGSGMLALILVSYQRIKHFASAGLEPWSSGMPDMHFATELCGKVGSTSFISNSLICHCYPSWYISSEDLKINESITRKITSWQFIKSMPVYCKF